MKTIYSIFISLVFSSLVHTSNVEFLSDLLPSNYRGTFEFSASEARFDDSLDVLGYMDNLGSSKPKKAEISDYSISYQFSNGLKLTAEKNTSFAEAERASIPKSISTDTNSDLYFLSFPIEYSNKIIEFEFFTKETIQDSLTIDCYEFNGLVIGGSCIEADVRLLNSSIYKETGERIYLPVLETQGSSEGEGINLRIKNKSINDFNVSHTFSYYEEEINLQFQSTILNTQDSFLRGIKINGVSSGSRFDQLRNELPQLTPWKEKIFKYSLNTTYSLSERLALSGKASIIKVSRDNYISNPNKKDYDSNQLLEIGLFFEAHKNLLFYSRLSLTTQYLLGITPISYNRRTNHLFDHPYGQLYVGTLLKF